MMNVHKQIESDWLWYTQHYLQTDNFTLHEYLGAKIGRITIKPNEPFYYLIARVVYTLSDGSVPALAITITILDYALVGAAVFIIGRHYANSIQTASFSLVLAGCTIFAITFTLVMHLVRQELSTSIAALAFSMLITRRVYIAFALSILAMITHQSAFLFIWVFFVPQVLERLFGRSFALRGVALFLAVCLSGIAGYLIANSEVSSLGAKNDGSVSTAIFALDIFIALLVVGCTLLSPPNALRRTIVESYVLFYASFAALSVIPLAALRLYFYMDFLRGISIMILVLSFVPARYARAIQVPVGLLILTLSLLYTNARIESSVFRYQGSFSSYITAMPTL